ATVLTPHYKGCSQIETRDSPIYRWWKTCYPSSQLIIDGSLAFCEQPPVVRWCFIGAASALVANS
ncbi:hypothetical protein HAX54_007103, partial [Datura stramonium]|nr:hypothetical protein [Datura stramonium]